MAIFASSTFMASMLSRSVRVQMPLLSRFMGTLSSIDPMIAELNKEMESIFGSSPPASIDDSQAEPQLTSHGLSNGESFLTHVDSKGEAQMVDISVKADTKRVATASCKVFLGQSAFKLVAANQIAKGDVLSVAKIAGITGAKQTSSLIPLCHNISLAHVGVDLTLNEKEFSIDITGEAATTGKTGVEMEALTAVSVTGLTVYDMCKAVSKDIKITDIQLERKTGGKSGTWCRSGVDESSSHANVAYDC